MARTGKSLTTMQHQQVIENFVKNGQGGHGTYVKADENVLYSQFPENYQPYGRYYDGNAGQTTPLAVHLEDDNLLVNGAGFSYPAMGYQLDILRTLQNTKRKKFGVVPFSSIVAARTDGKVVIGTRRRFLPEIFRKRSRLSFRARESSGGK
jgi:hypothetical protein